jgi:hypothetical protein
MRGFDRRHPVLRPTSGGPTGGASRGGRPGYPGAEQAPQLSTSVYRAPLLTNRNCAGSFLSKG